jgi:hypothetical protein
LNPTAFSLCGIIRDSGRRGLRAISLPDTITGPMPISGMQRAIAVFALVAATTDAVSASCIVGLSNEEHLARATVVFLGRVVGERLDAEAETTFEVERTWKGVVEKQVQVVSCSPRGTLICSNTVDFGVGERYLVFASGTPLRTSECTLTRPAAMARDLITWLDTNKVIRLPDMRVKPTGEPPSPK